MAISQCGAGHVRYVARSGVWGVCRRVDRSWPQVCPEYPQSAALTLLQGAFRAW